MPQASDAGTDPLTRFLTTARKRWKTGADAEVDNRSEGYLDLRFLNLEQWPDRIKQLRSVQGRERPCLTIDQIGEPFRQLTNRQRESKPSIQINPEDGEANDDTAEVLQGLIRAIEYDSDAQIAYDTAFEGAAGIGWGYARILSEVDPNGDGRDQNLIVDMIENPFSVYLDPGTRKWDRRDMRYAFIVQDIPKDEYISLYGESAVSKGGASLSDFSGLGDEAKDWFPEGAVRIAEYYYIDDVKGTDGRTRPQVMWCKINGLEVLEGNEGKTAGRRIPGRTIPIRPCFGQVLNVNGKRVYRGIVRAGRGPQESYNYQNSALVEELALAPKAKALLAEGQDEGYESMWDNANTEAYSRLIYKPTTIGDKLVGQPSAINFTDPAKIQALVLAINQAKQDLRSTTGWYDATDPSRKNTDQSGRAILARKESQNQGSVNYLDNFNRFVTSLGKLMLEWIPEIYDRPGRIVRVLGMEDEFERVMIGQPYRDVNGKPVPVDPNIAELAEDIKHFDLKKGIYGVRVSPGTDHITRKAEAAEWQFKLLEARPELMGVFGDIAFKNLDGPGHDQIAERIARTIPPQIKGDDKEGQPQIPPEVHQKMAEMDQFVQAAKQKIEELQKQVDTQGIKASADLQKAQLQGQIDLQKSDMESTAKLRQSAADDAGPRRTADLADHDRSGDGEGEHRC